ncbi:glycerol-3-phosphate 1-O-acyltransferase PlsY [Seleniivibrio woodruffii]|uniref:Glycerol-3-phosphate acyltransferase n=1 Tax=Seleniivibrio woodruffii TaxID=1078050 RepID=A0A4R1KCF3_9BACT|nr:glycerol-3-phosphate 1-O-acyltransferase PlsY [Seleniivibrio woodruffii]TCK60839.1 acyl-phosphate glycerol-3-phosphate acyltransferase [Seleniivibrio woodruffii]TVZ36469.1 acyl-phosphate glycerol-3-phosphate acyltransferase [Seleniivibrio woodruffii]
MSFVSVLIYFLVIALCYLIGSIPTAYLVVKRIKGIDIRTVGSGNVGASNAARVLGKWGFIGVLFADAMKGFLPVMLLKALYGEDTLVLAGAVALVVGHSFTCFLKFKGGKGVATGLGIFLALAPFQLLIAAVIFGVMLAVFRMISLGSITAAAFLAAMVWFGTEWHYLRYMTLIIAVLVIWLHRGNIARIVRGEERKVGERTS